MRIPPYAVFLLFAHACSGQVDADRCAGVSCPSLEACDPRTGACAPLPSCSSPDDCGGGPCIADVCSSCTTNVTCSEELLCDSDSGTCVPCRGDPDCGGAFPVCGASGCVECTDPADCGGGTPYCVNSRCAQCTGDANCGSLRCAPSGTCTTECLTDLDCPVEAPQCRSGLCLECRETSDCPAGMGCYRGACLPAMDGDTCDVATQVDMVSGSVILAGDLTPYGAESGDDFIASADVYYRLNVPSEGLLHGDISATGMLPLIEFEVLWGTCERLALLAASGEGNGAAQVRDVFVTPGSYVVRIKTTPGFARTFALHLWLTEGARAPGNSCLKPIEVSLDGNGEATYTGSTVGMLPGAPYNCDLNSEQPDLVYAIDLTVTSHLYAVATPTDPGFDLGLHLRSFCHDGYSDRACSGAPQPGVPETINDGPLPAGRYYLVVDSESQTVGPFELAIEVTAWATNDLCAGAIPLVFNNGVATLNAELEPAGSEQCACYDMDCNHHLAYTLSTAGLGDQALAVDVEPTTPGFEAGVSLTSVCGGFAAEQVIACDGYGNSNQATRLEIPLLPEGEYFLQVGTAYYAPHPAAFTLTATLSPAVPPPANNDCTSPQPLDLSSGNVQVSGDTRGATDNQTAMCGDVHLGPGRDAVYAVTLPGRGMLSVEVTPGMASFDPYVKIDQTCPPPSSGTIPVTCQNTSGPGLVESFALPVALSPVYLWVDGAAESEGTFTLALAFAAAAANDLCAAAADLAVGASADGDSSQAFSDPTTTTCGGGDRGGPDLYYRFTPAQNGTRTVTVTPTGFDARLDVLSDCTGGATCMGTSDQGGVGVVESVTFTATRNLTYYVVVDSPTTGGSFTVRVD